MLLGIMFKKQKNKDQINKPKKVFWKFLFILPVLFSFIYSRRKQIKEKVTVNSDHFAEVLADECDHLPKQILSMKKKFKNYLKDFFVPHVGNDHQPKGLSTKALKAYALVLVVIKIFTVGFLFLTYPNPAVLSQKISEEIFNLTNTSRVQENLEEVVWNDELARAAQAKADNMVASGYFAHVGPDGKQPWQWIDKTNYHFLYMGENLAMDFSSAQIAHSAFHQSPSHWKNILNPKYQDFGAGVAVGKIDGRDTIVLVEFFGSEKTPIASAVLPPARAAETPVVENNNQVVTEPNPIIQPVVEPTPVTPPPPAVEPVKPVVVEEPINVVPEPAEINLEPIESPDSVNTEVIVEPVPGVQPQELIPEITQPTEFNAAESPVIVPGTDEFAQKGLVEYVILYSRYAFLLFLVALCVMLLVNVLVKPHIQHNHMIMETLGMLILVATLLLTRFHFIEQIQQVIIF
jgi:uncharacterized protein YkwD